MECYCVARNKPIRHEITKPQTATVINLWFWGLLAYPELYCDWPVHNQHSWNFSGVHSFLSLTVTKWLKIIIGLVIALAAVVACYDLTSLLGEQGNLSIYFKRNCQTPWTSRAQNWKRVKDKEWREVTSRLKKNEQKREREGIFPVAPQLISSLSFFQRCSPLHSITAILNTLWEKVWGELKLHWTEFERYGLDGLLRKSGFNEILK